MSFFIVSLCTFLQQSCVLSRFLQELVEVNSKGLSTSKYQGCTTIHNPLGTGLEGG